jgi:hypothetical protein
VLQETAYKIQQILRRVDTIRSITIFSRETDGTATQETISGHENTEGISSFYLMLTIFTATE